ncbi:MAG: hypothetical protein KJ645_06155 [Planctomycetes bacterium]|nr:hypothetical protein [Planctomycetota bacterium]
MVFHFPIRLRGLVPALLFLTAACTSPVLEFEPYLWDPALSVKAKLSEQVLGVNLEETIDFEDDLGIKEEAFFGGRFKWFTGDNSWIRLDYLPVSYDSDILAGRTILFNGKWLLKGRPVSTNLDMEYLRLGWAWRFIDIDDGFIKLGPLLELKGFLLDATVDAPSWLSYLDIHESESLNFVLPTVGAVVDLNPIDELNIYGEASGMSAGKYGFAVDAEAGLKFIPIDNVSISAGFRYLAFETEIHDDEVNADLSGPFLALSIRF